MVHPSGAAWHSPVLSASLAIVAITITSRGWTQLGEHTYARRYEPFDVTIGVVVGAEGLLIVDTRGNAAEGAELRDDIGELSELPIRYVVNTHQHFDHTLGNAAFAGVPLVGHESLTETLPVHLEQARTASADDPRGEAMRASATRVPDVTFSSAWSADLGGCLVEVAHPGPAHTGGDVVVKVVPDKVAFAGDLVEESGPPSWGDDSYPLNWGDALDLLVGLCEPEATIVPGHGNAVDRDFVQEQRQVILDVADQIRGCAAEGLTVDDALTRDWPFEPARLTQAIRRGYERLGR